MANVLRDFFILEFAIYNIGNVTKQFRWISQGLAEVRDEFVAIDNIMSEINKKTEKLRELDVVAKSMRKLRESRPTDEELTENIVKLGKEITVLQKEILQLTQQLENMNVKAYVSNKLFGNLAALFATKFSGLSLVLKTFLDNFVRLEREAVSLSNTLGISETRAFAIAKAFENIGLNANQFANAMTQFQMRFFRDMRLPLLLTRFGIDVSTLFRNQGTRGQFGIQQISSTNLINFIAEIQKVGDTLRRLPPFQRAFLAQTLGKEIVDMATILQRYNIGQLIKDYMKVFTPDLIAQTRLTIIQLQLVIAEFWKIIMPFVRQLATIVSYFSRFLRWIGEMYEGSRIFRALANVVLMIVSLGAAFLSYAYIVRLVKNTIDSASIAFALLKFYVDKASVSLFNFNAQMQNTSTVAGVARFMQAGIGIGAITTSLIAGVFTGLIGLIGLGYLFSELRGMNDAMQSIEDSNAQIAQNTAMTNMYLSNLTADIRSLVRTTALGGTVAPFYQILNMQMMMQYGLMTNTSAI